jgi:tRNA-binding EMAP/Myf-like protein
MITYDDFKKVEIRAGKILSAEKIVGTDKLLKLMVDFGEKKEVVGETCEVVGDIKSEPAKIPMTVSAPRQIVSGIALRFPDPSVLVGKTCMFVANLEPRTICGNESNGMLFAVSTPEGGFSLLEPNDTIPPGTLAI